MQMWRDTRFRSSPLCFGLVKFRKGARCALILALERRVSAETPKGVPSAGRRTLSRSRANRDRPSKADAIPFSDSRIFLFCFKFLGARDRYQPKPRSGPPRHMQKEQAKCLFFFAWSERRESNPRESAWEADAIPLGDSRMFMSSRANRDRPSKADAIPFSGSRNRFTDIVYNIFRKKANKKGRL